MIHSPPFIPRTFNATNALTPDPTAMIKCENPKNLTNKLEVCEEKVIIQR